MKFNMLMELLVSMGVGILLGLLAVNLVMTLKMYGIC